MRLSPSDVATLTTLFVRIAQLYDCIAFEPPSGAPLIPGDLCEVAKEKARSLSEDCNTWAENATHGGRLEDSPTSALMRVLSGALRKGALGLARSSPLVDAMREEIFRTKCGPDWLIPDPATFAALEMRRILLGGSGTAVAEVGARIAIRVALLDQIESRH